MPTLSFVALSFQTTQLDPATVSKASYLKIVDGNITRVDDISIIPPATSSETDSNNPAKAVAWTDALAELSMVVGKLPIVSYYRDADKEIFQAASRRSGITPPTFHWLDCRALARRTLAELADHQLSTVLKALGLFDDDGDKSTVEQTARIVLTLAQQDEAASLKELWGDLYHQPDDLLDLEATLQEVPTPEADPTDQRIVDESDASPLSLPVPAGHEASEEDTAALAHQSALDPESPESAPSNDPQSARETDRLFEHTPQAEGQADASFDVRPQEEPSEDSLPGPDDLTTQSALELDDFDEPEFLKIPGDAVQLDSLSKDHPHDAHPGHDDTSKRVTDLSAPNNVMGSDPSEVREAGAVEDTEQASDEVVGQGSSWEPHEATDDVQHTAADDMNIVQDEPEPSDASALHEVEPQSATTWEKSSSQPLEPIAQPGASSSGPNSGTRAPKNPHPIDVRPSLRPGQKQQKASASTGRIWGAVGMIFFGLLTVLGLGLTIMAGMLFFTSNELLLETKIAGVILTGAITLLGVLMTVLSYRSYKNNA